MVGSATVEKSNTAPDGMLASACGARAPAVDTRENVASRMPASDTVLNAVTTVASAAVMSDTRLASVMPVRWVRKLPTPPFASYTLRLILPFAIAQFLQDT